MPSLNSLVERAMRQAEKQSRLNRTQQKKRFEREQREKDQRAWMKPYEVRNMEAAEKGMRPQESPATGRATGTQRGGSPQGPTGTQKLENMRLQREVGAGRLAPSNAQGMTTGALKTFAASRPDLFTGGENKDSGFDRKDIANYRQDIMNNLSKEYRDMKAMGNVPTDETEKPVSFERWAASEIPKRMALIHGGGQSAASGQQAGQGAMPWDTQKAVNDQKAQSQWQNMSYGYTDESGKLVNPENVKMEMTDTGLHGVNKQGQHRSLYFQDAEPGRDYSGSRGKQEYLAGNAPQFTREAVSARGDKNSPSFAQTMGGGTGKAIPKSPPQASPPAGVGPEQERPKPWQVRADNRRQIEKQKSTLPEEMPPLHLKQVASAQPEQEPSNPQQALYGRQEWKPSPLWTKLQGWAGKHSIPEDQKRYGEDQIAFSLRQAGLENDLTKLKQMSRNLQLRYPNASEKEIVEMIRRSTETQGKY